MQGSTGGSARRQRDWVGGGEGKMRARAFGVVSTGRNGQSRISRLRLASLIHFSRLWGLGPAPSCLVLGLGVIRKGDY